MRKSSCREWSGSIGCFACWRQPIRNSFSQFAAAFDFASGPKGHVFLAHGSARLNRLLKSSVSARFVSGHDFSRADNLFVFVTAMDLLLRLFQQPVKPCPTQSSGLCKELPTQDASCFFTSSLSSLPSTRASPNLALAFFITAPMSFMVGDPISAMVARTVATISSSPTAFGM